MPETNTSQGGQQLTSPREETIKDRKAEDIKGLVFKFRFIRWVLFAVMAFCLGVIYIMPKISSFKSRTSSGTAWTILIISILLWYGSHCLKFVRAWENGVVFRFGTLVGSPREKPEELKGLKNFLKRFWGLTGKGSRGSGPTWVWYVIDKFVFVRMDQRLGKPIELSLLCGLSGKKLEVNVKAFFVYRIENAANFLVKTTNAIDLIADMVESGIGSLVGESEFSQLVEKRAELADKLMEDINSRISDWGLTVKQVRIKDIDPQEDVLREMQGVIKAENQAKAKIEEAKGIAQAEIEKANGQAQARKTLAEVKKFEMQQEAEGAGSLIARQGEAYAGPGGERVFGAKVSESIKPADKTIVVNLGEKPEDGIIGAAIGALAGGFSKKPTT